MTLRWVTVYRISVSLFITLALKGQTLKEAAVARGLTMGTAVESQYLTDPSYASMLAGQYSQVEPENEMKWRISIPCREFILLGLAMPLFPSLPKMA